MVYLAPPRRQAPKKKTAAPLFALIAMVGILLASYPSIAQWTTAWQRSGVVTGHAATVQRASESERSALLSAAEQYNDAMPGVLVTDPYSLSDATDGKGGAWENYLKQLSLDGSGVMATVRIPSINVNLPVRHGTDDRVLAGGAGHLFGSSLPVGGERSHSVITAHTALARAHLFDDLDKVDIGEVFHLDVAGETLTYEVESVEVVLPHEIEALQLEAGRDLVTLVTCTPKTVNTHRLLVRGERIFPDAASIEGAGDNVDSTRPGFPWWMLWVGGSAVGLSIYAFRRT